MHCSRRIFFCLAFFYLAIPLAACGNICELQVLPFTALERYEAARVLGLRPTKDIRSFQPQVGVRVQRRAADGSPLAATLRVLSDNQKNKIYLIGDFNDWGEKRSEADRLHAVRGTPYFEGPFHDLENGAQYRLLLNGQSVLDPAATTFSSFSPAAALNAKPRATLNSVFWDTERPPLGKDATPLFSVPPAVDLRGKAIVLGETELTALVQKWPSGERLGPERTVDTYTFVAQSGIIPELRNMGYNAIEFLPFQSSLDGTAWVMRYQVFGLFGPSSEYGTPDEFRQMIAAFNRAGIAVIMDAVVGHYPQVGNQGTRSLAGIGPAEWKKADGKSLFGNLPSPWGTNRYDFENPFVRQFLIDSILTNIKQYNISGVRLDNLDGIRLLPGGSVFLRELAEQIRAYQPSTLLIGEMFFGDAQVLESLASPSGLGINFRTDSTFFDWIKDNALKRTEEIDMNGLRSALRAPWDWNEAARLKYITNHDESANPRNGATGAYFATLVKGDNNGLWPYVEMKTRCFASLALLSSPIYMDLPQLRLLQEGDFFKNPAIQWELRNSASQRFSNAYFRRLSWYVQSEPAFAFENLRPDLENHIDYTNKVISLKRTDPQSGKKIYVLINLGDRAFTDYAFGIEPTTAAAPPAAPPAADSVAAPAAVANPRTTSPLRLVLDSDETEFGGSNRLAPLLMRDRTLLSSAQGLHGKPGSVVVPFLAPYGVVILEEQP